MVYFLNLRLYSAKRYTSLFTIKIWPNLPIRQLSSRYFDTFYLLAGRFWRRYRQTKIFLTPWGPLVSLSSIAHIYWVEKVELQGCMQLGRFTKSLGRNFGSVFSISQDSEIKETLRWLILNSIYFHFLPRKFDDWVLEAGTINQKCFQIPQNFNHLTSDEKKVE